MDDQFKFDAFLSYNSKDQRSGDSIPAKFGEGLECSRVLACPAETPARRRMPCMLWNAFDSDWAQLACSAVAPE